MKKFLLIVSILCLSLLGCGNKEQSKESSIEKEQVVKVDILKEINKKEYSLKDNSKITIGFLDDRVFGTSGVNRYHGGYTLKDNKITFGMMGATMMAGPEDAMKKEQEYLAWLHGEKEISISGDILKIGDKEFTFKSVVEEKENK